MRFLFLILLSILVILSCKRTIDGGDFYIAKDKLLLVSSLGDSLTCRTVVWGLAGGNEKKIMFLGSRPSKSVECDLQNEICILGDSPIFYSARGDTLTLYSESLLDTVNNMKTIVVEQVAITTMTRIEYQSNHERLGLGMVGKIREGHQDNGDSLQ